jgi:hypothetical protein
MKKRNAAMALIALVAALSQGCKTVQSIIITSEPSKTVYGQGQDLDVTGLTVLGLYKDDSTKQVRVGPSNVYGYSKTRTGQQTVTVRVGEGTATFTVTVKPLVGISLTRPPTKQMYRQGETLDLDGIVLVGTWEDIGSDRIAVTGEMVSTTNLDLPGTQTITIFFENEMVDFPVTVVPLSSIAITQLPAKLVYRQGETLDLRGLTVTGTWEGLGNQRIAVGSEDASGYNPTSIGQQVISIRVQDLSATFQITVKGLMTIAVSTPPQKIIYNYGEALDLTGLAVIGTYNDSSYEQLAVSSSNISGYNPSQQGNQTVVITIDGRIAVFTVAVLPKPAGN